jgi:hypothetical protein
MVHAVMGRDEIKIAYIFGLIDVSIIKDSHRRCAGRDSPTVR